MYRRIRERILIRNSFSPWFLGSTRYAYGSRKVALGNKKNRESTTTFFRTENRICYCSKILLFDGFFGDTKPTVFRAKTTRFHSNELNGLIKYY